MNSLDFELVLPNHWQSSTLVIAIVVCMALAAFFAGSETAMMALNRYRLRHLVRQKHGGAQRAERLLRRPDRLIGVILVGNNVVNALSAVFASILGERMFGDKGILATSMFVTLVFIVFGEIAPKTLAALFPERVAFPTSWVLKPLLTSLYPIVYVANGISNFLLRPFTKHASTAGDDHLNVEELRTLLHENVRLPRRRRSMMLRILELEQVKVNDIMVPRSEVVGIDLENELADIIELIRTTQHTRLPVYRGTLNEIVGILHTRNAARFLTEPQPTKASLMRETSEPYFVPEGTPLHTQLFNFQNEHRRIALVVDEYGEIQGIITLEDILEEIVGEFTTDFAASIPEVVPQKDGSFIVDGSALLRDVNRALDWRLPVRGPRTLNGLLVEYLEFIPEANVCVTIEGYRMETLAIKDNLVRSLKVTPPERLELDEDEESG